MAEFSIQDVAFTGFGVVRHHPKALFAWWLFALAFSLLLGAVFVGLAGPDFVKLVAISGQPTADPAQLMALMGRLAPAYVVFLVLTLTWPNAILERGDDPRSTATPQDDRYGYLRLGAMKAASTGPPSPDLARVHWRLSRRRYRRWNCRGTLPGGDPGRDLN